MPLYKKIHRCTECGLVMDRDENSAVNIFARHLTRLAMLSIARYLARLGPHTDDSVRCADVFTAIYESSRILILLANPSLLPTAANPLRDVWCKSGPGPLLHHTSKDIRAAEGCEKWLAKTFASSDDS
jgi:hypothetical protein